MQQRRLRLGDILDDYCPRERRITNHAVVAMIDEQVKQTRCTTCEAEHEYKEARVPAPRRRKNGVATAEPVISVPPPAAAIADTEDDVLPDLSTDDSNESLEDATAVAAAVASDVEPPAISDDEGPVHRPLIRATLPRPEGQVQDWKEPDFTIRQPGRGGRDVDGNRNGHHAGHGQGNRPGRHRRGMRAGGGHGNPGGDQSRFGGPRHGHGNSRSAGGHNNPGQRQHGNRPGGNQRGPGRKRGR